MKKDDFDRYIEEVVRILSFSKKEKADLRLKLQFLMKERPLPLTKSKTHSKKVSPYYHYFSWFHVQYIPAFIMFIIFVGGGVSFAAEGALPGDPLYFVKTRFNEEVRGSIILNPTLKAQWELSIANLRLNEAQKLADEGRLSVESKIELNNNFKMHSDNFDSKLEELAKDGMVEKALHLNETAAPSLDARGDILFELAGGESGSVEKSNKISSPKSEPIAAPSMMRMEVLPDHNGGDQENQDQTISNEPQTFVQIGLPASPASSTHFETDASTEILSKDSRQKIDEVISSIANANYATDTPPVLQAKEAIKSAEDHYEEGLQRSKEGNGGESVTSLQKAKREAQKAKLIIIGEENEKDSKETKDVNSPSLEVPSVFHKSL